MLCRPCNNARTKPFDQAYQIFSGWVLAAATTLHSKEAIDFAEVYGGAHAGKSLNLLRYFAKSLGCRIADAGIEPPEGLRRVLTDVHLSDTKPLVVTFAINEPRHRICPSLLQHYVAAPITGQPRTGARREEKMNRTLCGLSLAAALLPWIGAARAQSAADIEAVTEANNAFYAAESALDMPSMEKVWAHEDYVAFAVPRTKEPTIGWTAVQSLLTRNFANLSQISLMPVDTHLHVYGDSAWAFGKEEIGSASKLKDGTPLSSRPTIVTNIFEKHGGKWLMVAHHAQEIPQ